MLAGPPFDIWQIQSRFTEKPFRGSNFCRKMDDAMLVGKNRPTRLHS